MQAANDLDAFSARRPADCSPLSLDPYGCRASILDAEQASQPVIFVGANAGAALLNKE